jgi:hypothetical protein
MEYFYGHVAYGYVPQRFGYWLLEKCWLKEGLLHILFPNGLEYIIKTEYLLSFTHEERATYGVRRKNDVFGQAEASKNALIVKAQRRIQSGICSWGEKCACFGNMNLYLNDSTRVPLEIEHILMLCEPYYNAYGWFGRHNGPIEDYYGSVDSQCVGVRVVPQRLKNAGYFGIREMLVHKKCCRAEMTLSSGDTLYLRLSSDGVLTGQIMSLPSHYELNDRTRKKEWRILIQDSDPSIVARIETMVADYYFCRDYRFMGHRSEYERNRSWVAYAPKCLLKAGEWRKTLCLDKPTDVPFLEK